MSILKSFKRGVKRAAKGAKSSFEKFEETSARIEKKRAKGRVTKLARIKQETKLAKAQAGLARARQSIPRARPQQSFDVLGLGGFGGGMFAEPEPRKKKAKRKKAKSRSITFNY